MKTIQLWMNKVVLLISKIHIIIWFQWFFLTLLTFPHSEYDDKMRMNLNTADSTQTETYVKYGTDNLFLYCHSEKLICNCWMLSIHSSVPKNSLLKILFGINFFISSRKKSNWTRKEIWIFFSYSKFISWWQYKML